MKVLLLSGYDAASHKRWRQGLADHLPDISFTQLALAPRFFNWRIRGSSLTFARLKTAALKAHYDLLVCTSMVDLSALRGMVPELAAIPTILYFHENQFAYPPSAQQHKSVEPQIVTLYSAVCADKIVFNSAFNRRSFLAGARQLLQKLPRWGRSGTGLIAGAKKPGFAGSSGRESVYRNSVESGQASR